MYMCRLYDILTQYRYSFGKKIIELLGVPQIYIYVRTLSQKLWDHMQHGPNGDVQIHQLTYCVHRQVILAHVSFGHLCSTIRTGFMVLMHIADALVVQFSWVFYGWKMWSHHLGAVLSCLADTTWLSQSVNLKCRACRLTGRLPNWCH